jgi:hypothetical protein
MEYSLSKTGVINQITMMRLGIKLNLGKILRKIYPDI